MTEKNTHDNATKPKIVTVHMADGGTMDVPVAQGADNSAWRRIIRAQERKQAVRRFFREIAQSLKNML